MSWIGSSSVWHRRRVLIGTFDFNLLFFLIFTVVVTVFFFILSITIHLDCQINWFLLFRKISEDRSRVRGSRNRRWRTVFRRRTWRWEWGRCWWWLCCVSSLVTRRVTMMMVMLMVSLFVVFSLCFDGRTISVCGRNSLLSLLWLLLHLGQMLLLLLKQSCVTQEVGSKELRIKTKSMNHTLEQCGCRGNLIGRTLSFDISTQVCRRSWGRSRMMTVLSYRTRWSERWWPRARWPCCWNRRSGGVLRRRWRRIMSKGMQRRVEQCSCWCRGIRWVHHRKWRRQRRHGQSRMEWIERSQGL